MLHSFKRCSSVGSPCSPKLLRFCTLSVVLESNFGCLRILIIYVSISLSLAPNFDWILGIFGVVCTALMVCLFLCFFAVGPRRLIIKRVRIENSPLYFPGGSYDPNEGYVLPKVTLKAESRLSFWLYMRELYMRERSPSLTELDRLAQGRFYYTFIQRVRLLVENNLRSVDLSFLMVTNSHSQYPLKLSGCLVTGGDSVLIQDFAQR